MDQKIITVAQQKGGAGKSTLTAHLAVSFAQMGMHPTIIDIDPQASLGYWFEKRQEIDPEKLKNKVDYVSVTGWRLHSEISRLKGKSDVILVDSPPHTQTETKTAIRAADLVLLPIQPSPTDLWATNVTIDLISSERVPYRLVMNRIIRSSNIAKEIAEKFENVLPQALSNRVVFASSMLKGLCASEISSATAAKEEIHSLTKEITQLLFPKKAKLKAAS